MRIILKEDVTKLGHRGQVVDVADGYARNFLLPRKLAVEVSAANLRSLERIQGALARREATEKSAAENLAGQLAAITLTLSRKAGENDQLFGSVTASDLADALAAQGFSVDKRRIELDQPIKIVGDYSVPVRLHREVTANFKIVVKAEQA